MSTEQEPYRTLTELAAMNPEPSFAEGKRAGRLEAYRELRDLARLHQRRYRGCASVEQFVEQVVEDIDAEIARIEGGAAEECGDKKAVRRASPR